ncbi:hypothetical protein [Bacteroides nordii]|uniref:hypothetical protein n=1 Tax=Bacteroides nordii TaxID=291645 RepID=UPI0026DCA533|nr:hypothetical protein [Bacteroides nordii]
MNEDRKMTLQQRAIVDMYFNNCTKEELLMKLETKFKKLSKGDKIRINGGFRAMIEIGSFTEIVSRRFSVRNLKHLFYTLAYKLRHFVATLTANCLKSFSAK